MESGSADDILRQAADVADEHYEKLELEAARMLILNAFEALPWDLQTAYWEYQELYGLRKLREASLAWEAWMQKARDMGVI